MKRLFWMILGLVLCSGIANAQVQPLGNPPLPPGTNQWQLTYDVEFTQGTTGSLNGGTGNTDWCTPGIGDTTNPTGALGFVGNNVNNDCQPYFGSPPTAPYNTIISPPGIGNVLGLQMLPGPIGDNNYYDNSGAWLSSQNVLTQKYGYWEVVVQQPHDFNGEGDGYHTDVWLTVPGRHDFLPNANNNVGEPCQDELDIMETDRGTGNGTYGWTYVADAGPIVGNNGNAVMFTNGSDLSTGFHTYGALWNPIGGSQGQWSTYLDGVRQTGPWNVDDSCWGGGAYIFPGWMERTTVGFDGGAPVDSTTSTNDPMMVKYLRIWQAVNGSPTPVPTPTARPGPQQATSCLPQVTNPAAPSPLSGVVTVGGVGNCNGTYDNLRWSFGPTSGTGEIGFVNIPFGSTTAQLDTTKYPDGSYQAAVAVFLDPADNQQVSNYSSLFFFNINNSRHSRRHPK